MLIDVLPRINAEGNARELDHMWCARSEKPKKAVKLSASPIYECIGEMNLKPCRPTSKP